MEDVHPSPTAGNGWRIRQKTAKPGDPADNRVECAQCGFRFNADRDTEGDSGSEESVAGITPQQVVVPINNVQAKLPVHLRGMTTFAATSRTVTDPVVSSGCPFCGTWNPRGRFRNDGAFENSKDVRNQ